MTARIAADERKRLALIPEGTSRRRTPASTASARARTAAAAAGAATAGRAATTARPSSTRSRAASKRPSVVVPERAPEVDETAPLGEVGLEAEGVLVDAVVLGRGPGLESDDDAAEAVSDGDDLVVAPADGEESDDAEVAADGESADGEAEESEENTEGEADADGEAAAPQRAASNISTSDEGLLASYFQDLGRCAPLGAAEQERALSEIADLEVRTWQRALEHAEGAVAVDTMVSALFNATDSTGMQAVRAAAGLEPQLGAPRRKGFASANEAERKAMRAALAAARSSRRVGPSATATSRAALLLRRFDTGGIL